ncbi:MAG: YggT family protein [Alphaproteobacteria bacterium]|nr:YggT family protein [Alphaproteobacteria bacterium]
MPVGNALFAAFLDVTYAVLNFVWWAVILSVALSWLVSFDIVNPHNRFVRVLGDLLARITEPLLAPIRRILPPMGGMDLSPMALIFIIYFIQRTLLHLVY